jgi:hypothetical protein
MPLENTGIQSFGHSQKAVALESAWLSCTRCKSWRPPENPRVNSNCVLSPIRTKTYQICWVQTFIPPNVVPVS